MSDREAYVAWYVSEFSRRPSHDGYESYITWQAWQAAQARYAGNESEHDWQLQSAGVWESYHVCTKCGQRFRENHDDNAEPPKSGCAGYAGGGEAETNSAWRPEYDGWEQLRRTEQPKVPDGRKRYSDSPYQGGYADGWNACREAILAAQQEPDTKTHIDLCQQLLEALEAVLECGSTTDQWWIDKARSAILAAQSQEVESET
jgi:hypothetical protein